MIKIESIREIQLIALGIAVEFDRICQNNNIPYYMLGGTMLGAIRHKGFIPWDDDMDFGIPRIYFNKFIEACKKDLSGEYKLISPTEYEYGITMEVFKMVNDKTLVIENENSERKMGIFIDIFPLDYSDNNWSTFSLNRTIEKLISLNSFGYRPIQGKLNYKGRIIRKLLRLLPKGSCLSLAHMLVKKKGDYISNYSGFWRKKETVPSCVFDTSVMYQFENYFFYGVKDYDKYLKCLYNDYMILPPEDKRHIHIIDCFYK